MNINVGKIISEHNNNFVILGLDNHKYAFFDSSNTFKVGELVCFRGEKIDDFYKAFFVDTLNDLNDKQKEYIAYILKK